MNVINVTDTYLEAFQMVSITLSVPEELKKQMEMYPELNWSEVARQAIRKKLLLLKKMEKLLEKSEMTEKDALELGRKVNKALSKKYKEMV